jgi:glycosyltransferase involved in cell wall biosynthesis
MKYDKPLVTIGIPTYNRQGLIARTIDSALMQDYENIQIIISDNASTDETERICCEYSGRDIRIVYFRHEKNNGPVANFDCVLEMAKGKYFMWLGDDDWVDANYISECVKKLNESVATSLVYGLPLYYKSAGYSHAGKVFSLTQRYWFSRVVSYYRQVTDNGMFYGVMRTSQVRHLRNQQVLGGDWHLIANMAAQGCIQCAGATSIHRELGGNSSSYGHIINALNLPAWHALFPYLSIAMTAWQDIAAQGAGYVQYPAIQRYAVACAAFIIILARGFVNRLRVLGSVLKRRFGELRQSK